jgi:hypothetical protein
VTIDRSAKWWTGTEFADVAEYLRACTADGYPAQEITQSVCSCGGKVFLLAGDPEEGCAQRTCISCQASAFIGDSGEYWAEADPEQCVCPVCQGRHYEIGVGFSLRDDGDVRWITVGERCVNCGLLGSFVDWKIDYSPTDSLLRQV